MNPIHRLFFILFFCSIVTPTTTTGAALRGAPGLALAHNGAANYQIVLPDPATIPEKTAARELQHYLQAVTGAAFPIHTEKSAPATAPRLLVGRSNTLERRLPNFPWNSLGQDGIVMKTAGRDILLAGGAPRGTLYAVFTFLEDTIGCRWWTATEQFIPHKPTLVIPPPNTVYVPKFRYREAFYRDVIRHPVFAAHLKCNGHFENIPPAYGGHYAILGWCHTFYQLLPPKKYFHSHPDWYSLRNGKRTAHHAQLCLTNPEMRRELTRVALGWIQAQPQAGIISISQNDCGGRCRCPKCRAVERAEGAPSGLLLQFVNAVAADIASRYPDMLVETLAYQYTRKPPRRVRPRKNVLIRLCSIECDFSKPLNGPANGNFRNDVLNWSAIAPNLYIWNYVADFHNYLFPHPNLRFQGRDLRFFAAHHVIGVFEEGDAGCSIGDFVRLRAWVLAHLLWNPNLDPATLTREFLEGYYGPAAPYLEAYLQLIQDAAERARVRLGCFNRNLDFLTLPVMNRATQLFAAAAKAVADKPALARRVRRERMPLDYVWLRRYSRLEHQARSGNLPFFGPKNPRSACEEFLRLARQWKAGSYREGRPFSRLADSLRARFGIPRPRRAPRR